MLPPAITADVFTFRRVLIKIWFPWEAGNQITCHRSATLECLVKVSSVSLLCYRSHWPLLCSSHREVIELRSRPRGSPPPPQRNAASSRVCSPLCRAAVTAQRTNKCCCLAGKLRRCLVWVGCLGSRGGLGFVLRVSKLLWTVHSLWWKRLASTSSGACKAKQTEKRGCFFRPRADCSLIISSTKLKSFLGSDLQAYLKLFGRSFCLSLLDFSVWLK